MAHAWWHFWNDEEESIFDPLAEIGGSIVDTVKDNAGALALGTAGIGLAQEGYRRLGEVGDDAYAAYSAPGGLADVIDQRLEFRPYTVTSPTGGQFGMLTQPPQEAKPVPSGKWPNDGSGTETTDGTSSEIPPEVQNMINQLQAGQITLEQFRAFITDFYNLNNIGNTAFAPNVAAMSAPPPSFAASEVGTSDPTDQGSVTNTDPPDFAGDTEFLLNLSPEERKFYEARLSGAESMFDLAEGNTVTVEDPDGTVRVIPREQHVYERMRAAQIPEEERARLALEERLAGQGRLGVRTSMFGGTPEQLAMEQAREEAKTKNILAAMEYAGQEQQRQAQLGSGMLAAGYIPQAQLLSALEPGMTMAERQRQALSQQASAYGETYSTGLEALLQSALGQAGLYGGFGTSLATAALGGLFQD